MAVTTTIGTRFLFTCEDQGRLEGKEAPENLGTSLYRCSGSKHLITGNRHKHNNSRRIQSKDGKGCPHSSKHGDPRGRDGEDARW